jgi:hypothetical protein
MPTIQILVFVTEDIGFEVPGQMIQASGSSSRTIFGSTVTTTARRETACRRTRISGAQVLIQGS